MTYFRRVHISLLLTSLSILTVLLVQIMPLLVWNYYAIQASKLMVQGIDLSVPPVIDSLPVMSDSTALEQATYYLFTAIRWRPGHPYAYRLIAKIYAVCGDWETSVGYINQARSLAPRNPLLAWDTSLVYEQMQHLGITSYPSATDALLQQSWLAAGFDGPKFIVHGDSLRQVGHSEQALIWYKRAAKLEPESGRPWYYIGLAYADMQADAQALQAWNKAAQLYEQASQSSPENRDIWYELGKVYESRQEWQAAVESYQRGVDADAGQVGASNLYYQIGRIQQDFMVPPDPAKALQAYRQALELDDYSTESWQKASTYFRQGMLLEAQGQWEDAIRDYQQALVLRPNLYSPHIYLAKVLWQQGKREAAKEQARQAVRLNPNNKQAYHLLGGFYRLEGNVTKARAMYVKILELDPQDEIAQQLLEDIDER